MSLIGRIDELSSNPKARKGWFYLVLIVFIALIILPTIFILFEVVPEWAAVDKVIHDPGSMSLIWGAVGNSFSIALLVTVLDIAVGLPMAWILVRKQFRAKKYLDTLLDMPLAFPTASIGISVVMFWGAPDGVTIPGLGLVFTPFLMMILLHTVFTYPYMVRSLAAILEQIDPNYETAGMTLGASRFTAVRTITLPLFRAGLTTGFILCFARSMSETGGTYIALRMMGLDTTWFTGPTYISYLKNQAEVDPTGALIVVSVIMIVFALILLLAVQYMMNKLKIPWTKVWPKWERTLSKKIAARSKDLFTYAFMFIIVVIPSFYIFAYMAAPSGAADIGALFGSIGTSFLIAGVAVVFDIIFGIPIALYIARKGNTKLGKALDALVNVPLIVPTTVLGVSLAAFWGSFGISSDFALLLVIMGHIAFTYPLMVRNITGAISEVDPSYVEIARTLGAKPLKAFSKILLPIIQSSVIAGGVLAFTRSLGETGATIAISGDVITAPIYIMNLINGEQFYQGALASVLLIIICFVLMFGIRYVTRRKDTDA
jgi:thiamine transport system permease protein